MTNLLFLYIHIYMYTLYIIYIWISFESTCILTCRGVVLHFSIKTLLWNMGENNNKTISRERHIKCTRKFTPHTSLYEQLCFRKFKLILYTRKRYYSFDQNFSPYNAVFNLRRQALINRVYNDCCEERVLLSKIGR